MDSGTRTKDLPYKFEAVGVNVSSGNLCDSTVSAPSLLASLITTNDFCLKHELHQTIILEFNLKLPKVRNFNSILIHTLIVIICNKVHHESKLREY